MPPIRQISFAVISVDEFGMTADVRVAQYQMYSRANRFLKLLLRGLKSALS